MLRNTILAGMGVLLLLTVTPKPAQAPLDTQPQVNYSVNTEHAIEAKPEVITPIETAPTPAEVPTPVVAQPEPTPVAPARWAVTWVDRAATVEQVNTALAVYQDMGMSKQGAAYLIGNFMQESHLIPCADIKGDGGLAWGLGQWHPTRRQDMPCGYVEQLTWAVNVEMVRDTPALRDVLFDPNASIETIQVMLHKWERWGTLGVRWQYANTIYQQL
jgi:hypothetical protein